jgi:1,4-dihydroxy-2-naphthoate polyprenyltransferase
MMQHYKPNQHYKKDDDHHQDKKPQQQQQERPPTWKVWVIAARPHTLTASISPCLVSLGYCYNKYLLSSSSSMSMSLDERTSLLLYTYFGLWLLFCITVQIGTNLHNDYSDYVQGADRIETRVGQLRATAQGWITPYETCCAATITLSITFITGIILIVMSHQINNIWLWFWIISSVFNAFAYTAGPYPLGYIGLSHCSIAYYGLADIFVFLYFGLVATYMLPFLLHCVIDTSTTNGSSSSSLFLQSPLRDSSTIQIIIYGIQIGLLATNIIVVNNLRDCTTDAVANKRTTTVRFGTTFSKVQYCGNYIVTYILVLISVWIISRSNPGRNAYYYNSLLFPLLTIVPAVREVRAILHKRGADLNSHVGGAAKVQFLFCIFVTMRLLLIPVV